MKKKAPTLEDEQRALSEARAEAKENPRSELVNTRLREALRSRRSPVVASAAKLIQAQSLDGFQDELKAAFGRFLEQPVKTDPGCTAKLAVIEALDYAESMDQAPFVIAARLVQFEAAWGPPVDTAAAVRQRGIFALARLGHQDFDLFAAELLADPEPPVRQAAADALLHRGERSGAALALLKLRTGDEDPMVLLSTMSALLALAPHYGLIELKSRLSAPKPELQELAALALGQSRKDAALSILLETLDTCVRPIERLPLLRGIGLHRSDRALTAMLEVIGQGSQSDAAAAVAALGARRFEPGMTARVREAARLNERARLDAVIEETFPTTDTPD